MSKIIAGIENLSDSQIKRIAGDMFHGRMADRSFRKYLVTYNGKADTVCIDADFSPHKRLYAVMIEPDVWQLEIPLYPGTYKYQMYVDGRVEGGIREIIADYKYDWMSDNN